MGKLMSVRMWLTIANGREEINTWMLNTFSIQHTLKLPLTFIISSNIIKPHIMKTILAGGGGVKGF